MTSGQSVVVPAAQNVGMPTVAPAEYASLDTQIGQLSVAVTEVGLAAVCWGSPRELARRYHVGANEGSAVPSIRSVESPGGDLTPTSAVIEQLHEYFAGVRRTFDVPLDWRWTTRPQQVVLEALYDSVAWGQTVTYGELAARSGTGMPARAIGGVMAANPLPIVVPCHRVVAASGLGGYSGGERSAEGDEAGGGLRAYGLETKRWLLTFEESMPPMLGWDPFARLDLDGTRRDIY